MKQFTTLITPQELASLQGAWIMDASFDLADTQAGERAYALAHLPNAVYFHLERDLSGPKHGSPPVTGRHPLPSRAAFASKLAQAGLNAGQQVVVVDNQSGMFAARAWWMLRWLGHTAVAVVDGGMQACVAAGLPTTAEPATHSRGSFAATGSAASAWGKADVAANLRSRAKLVIDARAPERFSGAVEPLDPVAGHIPNAINRWFKDNLNASGLFKEKAQLKSEWLSVLGKYTATESVAQCGSGATACHNLLAMEYAGLTGGLLYPGSWSEWSADASLPKEKAA
jgi:thiosulfate/3-mercaptopyruvate sulfurtransferase